MTSSDKLSRLYAAQEALQDLIAETPDQVLDALRDAMATAEEVAVDYESSLMNMPDSLQQGTTGQEIQEKIDACNSWASELDSAVSDLENEEWNPGLFTTRVAQAAEALEI